MQKKTLLKWSVAVVVGLLAIGACNDDTAVGPNGKAAPTKPSFLVDNNFNGSGNCLAQDAYDGGAVSSPSTLADTGRGGGCTANDIRVAHADLISWGLGSGPGKDTLATTEYDPANPPTCKEGDSLYVHLHSDIQQTTSAERTDIGIWVANDGGFARTGTCNHYNLIPPSFSTPDSLGVWNLDAD